ncbi:hypothetical protein B0H10DRAFT_1993651 [Mycena sp. CBHHK59/15]|nr:hypothetical protein B0H10DRAFT_1993651 [Mycena sp. CBHHK59/15]
MAPANRTPLRVARIVCLVRLPVPSSSDCYPSMPISLTATLPPWSGSRVNPRVKTFVTTWSHLTHPAALLFCPCAYSFPPINPRFIYSPGCVLACEWFPSQSLSQSLCHDLTHPALPRPPIFFDLVLFPPPPISPLLSVLGSWRDHRNIW